MPKTPWGPNWTSCTLPLPGKSWSGLRISETSREEIELDAKEGRSNREGQQESSDWSLRMLGAQEYDLHLPHVIYFLTDT